MKQVGLGGKRSFSGAIISPLWFGPRLRYTVLQDFTLPVITFIAWKTIKLATMALAVAMAGMMFPAIAEIKYCC